jgi:glycosyltransferase involved in cell wall biosynthesis
VYELASEDVIIAGFIEQLTPFLDQRRLAVAPLRFGAGIKGKIGTAMAAGLPSVASAVAAEGMGLTSGENIVVADGAEDFARAVALLYNDGDAWQKVSSAGIEFAERTWGKAAAATHLTVILDDIGLPRSAP